MILGDVAGARVVVLGLGITGRSVAAVLAQHGASVLASDAGRPTEADPLELIALGVEVELGSHDRASAAVPDADLVVPSPGLSPHRGFLADVVRGGARVVSEFDLAVALTAAPVVAVTGTNGKTTVSLLAERIAREAGMDAYLCGNTELPFIAAAAAHPDADLFVVEASSFRLAFCDSFHPRVAVITNFSPDHLDWHSSVDDYWAAKARIAALQDEGDLFVFPSAQPELAAMAPAPGPRCMPFGQVVSAGDAAWIEADDVVVRLGNQTVRASGVGRLAARGGHFALDAAAAAAALAFLGVDAPPVERALRSFEVAQHRLEPVGTLNGIDVIDDAVSANAHATIAAIRHVSAGRDARVVLIAGGRNKGIDLGPLASEARRLKALVAIGEASGELAGLFSSTSVPVTLAASMGEAVAAALDAAGPGDVVLLSPACASFDMFNGYADRGRAFREACRHLGVGS